MPGQPSTLELILHEVAQAVLPLSEAATRDPVPTGLTSLLTDAGVDVSTLGVSTDQLTAICADVASAVAAIEQAAGGNGPAGGAGTDPAQLAGRIADLVTQLHNLDRAPQPSDLGTAAERLLAYTITLYLRRQRPGVYAFLRLAGLMVEPSSDSRDTTPPRLDPRRLADLFSDPNKMLAQAYRWGGTDVDYPMLLDHLQQMALVLGFPAIAHRPDTDLLTALGVDITTLPNTASLRIALATFQTGEIATDVGLEVLAHRTPGSPDGVAIVPFGAGDLTERLPLDEHWSLQIDAEGDAAVPYGLVITPAGLVFEAVDGAARQLVLVVRLAIERDQPAGQSTTVLGSPTGSRLDAGTLSLTLFASANPADVGVEVDGTDWRIVAKAEPGDGFLATLLPPEGIQIPFSLGLGWSHSKGVYFVGSAGLRVELAVNKDLGPVHISSVSVEAVAGASTADPNAQRITANAAVTGRLQLGPFVVTVRDIGVRLGLQPGAEHPNAAIGAFEAGFKPPTGAGIAITNPAISGGGFLLLDEANGTYGGIVELTLVKTVSVVAIGIVTTKLPDGRPGFALLIIITAQGFTPIQLGMGFTLTGIGGLVALNRTVNADAIRNGLRDGILDSVMFVKDPVKNADRVLSTLDKVFPIARDRLVVGPMAEISWGTPTIVTLRLALLLDLPAPIRVVVLAALAVKLPTPQTPVVEIHVDAVGELDFGRGRLSLDASLHHSRILTFTLTGDLSLRLDWGTEPGFLLSIGGFHPRFKPPPGIRPLNRLALAAHRQRQPAGPVRGLPGDHPEHPADGRQGDGAPRHRRVRDRRRRVLRHPHPVVAVPPRGRGRRVGEHQRRRSHAPRPEPCPVGQPAPNRGTLQGPRPSASCSSRSPSAWTSPWGPHPRPPNRSSRST